jgi:hypothetical protein
MIRDVEAEKRKIAALTQEHALKVGEVTMASAGLQLALMTWFAILRSQTNDITQAARDWHSRKSDKLQRDQLRLALAEHRDRMPNAMDHIEWVCDWADKLRDFRDAFVHGTTAIAGLPDNPYVTFVHRFGLTDNEDTWKPVYDNPEESYRALMHDFGALRDFAMGVLSHIHTKGKYRQPSQPELTIPQVFPNLQ